MVVAVVAVVLSVTGSAVAAKLITGKQIKNGTITKSDLSKALREQLARLGVAGPVGPAGAPGQTGAKGDLGAKGETGPAGPGNLTTATVVVLDNTFNREFATIPGFGVLTATCDSSGLNFRVDFKNQAGKTIEWARAQSGDQFTGTAADGGVIAAISGGGGISTLEVSLPTASDGSARVAVVHAMLRVGGAGCNISASSLAN